MAADKMVALPEIRDFMRQQYEEHNAAESLTVEGESIEDALSAMGMVCL